MVLCTCVLVLPWGIQRSSSSSDFLLCPLTGLVLLSNPRSPSKLGYTVQEKGRRRRRRRRNRHTVQQHVDMSQTYMYMYIYMYRCTWGTSTPVTYWNLLPHSPSPLPVPPCCHGYQPALPWLVPSVLCCQRRAPQPRPRSHGRWETEESLSIVRQWQVSVSRRKRKGCGDGCSCTYLTLGSWLAWFTQDL